MLRVGSPPGVRFAEGALTLVIPIEEGELTLVTTIEEGELTLGRGVLHDPEFLRMIPPQCPQHIR